MRRLCPKCGLGVDADARFCRWCGGSLEAAAGEAASSAAASPPIPPPFPPSPGPGPAVPPSPGARPAWAEAPPSSGPTDVPPAPPPGSVPPFGGTVGYGYGDLPPSIPTHLVWAVLATILCCLPLGIVSLVYSAQVNTHLFRGDIPAAQRSSRMARNWAIAALLVAAAWWLLYALAVAVGGLGALRGLHSWQ